MLKVKQVAARLQLSLSKVYALIDSGKLAHHRMDGAIRVSEQQVQQYLEETRCGCYATPVVVPPTTRPQLKHLRLS